MAAAQPASHHIGSPRPGSPSGPPLNGSDPDTDVKSISRPDILKENVKTFFDESKGKVDQGLSRIFATFSIFGTLCTFCFAFFYTSKLFENKNCCLPPTSWSLDRNECCNKLLTDVQPSCCNSPRLGDQLTHCQISPEGGINSLACKRRGQSVSVLISTDFLNETSRRGLMPEVAARRAAMNLLGNCTTNANSQTYQQLSFAITIALVSVGSAFLLFAASQGQSVAIAMKELAIYRAYLQGENIEELKKIFLDTRISSRAKKHKWKSLQWTWLFFYQLLRTAFEGAPMSLISLFVLLLSLAIMGATWSASADSFCRMRLPSFKLVSQTVPYPLLSVILIAVSQTALGVQKQFEGFKKLQEGLLDLAQKSEDDIAKKADKEAVAKDIAWSLRVLAKRLTEWRSNDDLLGSPPPDLRTYTQDPGIRRLSSSEHQWAHDDIEAATLRATLEARSSFNYSERPVELEDEDSDQESPESTPLIRRPARPHASHLVDIQENPMAQPVLQAQSNRATRSVPSVYHQILQIGCRKHLHERGASVCCRHYRARQKASSRSIRSDWQLV